MLFVIFTYLEIVVDVLSLYKTPNKQVCLSACMFISVMKPVRDTHGEPGLPMIPPLIVMNVHPVEAGTNSSTFRPQLRDRLRSSLKTKITAFS